MHFQRGRMYKKARADEFGVLAMIAEDVTNILAKVALDAFAKFLNAVNVLLRHAPGAVGRIRCTRFEWLDLFLDLKIPGNVGDQIFERRESLHGLDGYGLIERQ